MTTKCLCRRIHWRKSGHFDDPDTRPDVSLNSGLSGRMVTLVIIALCDFSWSHGQHPVKLSFITFFKLFWTSLVVLNRSQMTRSTPELSSPLQTSAPHQHNSICCNYCCPLVRG
ncbi:hypothetical protein AVEN_62752-1, partial [Araneus ventricosus]